MKTIQVCPRFLVLSQNQTYLSVAQILTWINSEHFLLNFRSTSSSRPPLPNIKVDLEPPKLADYLDRPRLVSTLHVKKSSSSDRAQIQHSKRPIKDVSQYRNLRLGNFMEIPESEQDELIPERLRQYYLVKTYLQTRFTLVLNSTSIAWQNMEDQKTILFLTIFIETEIKMGRINKCIWTMYKQQIGSVFESLK